MLEFMFFRSQSPDPTVKYSVLFQNITHNLNLTVLKSKSSSDPNPIIVIKVGLNAIASLVTLSVLCAFAPQLANIHWHAVGTNSVFYCRRALINQGASAFVCCKVLYTTVISLFVSEYHASMSLDLSSDAFIYPRIPRREGIGSLFHLVKKL